VRREHTDRDLGSAEIMPGAPVVADQYGVWRVVYTAGKTPLPAGACLRLTVPFGFTPPQVSYRMSPGYLTVSASPPEVELDVSLSDPLGSPNLGVWGVHVFVTLTQGALAPGDSITLTYGAGLSKGARAWYFQGRAEFSVAVDPDGSRATGPDGFLLVADPQPALQVEAGTAAGLFVSTPSIVAPGERFDARITVRDANENTVQDFEGDVVLTIPGCEPTACRFEAGDGGHRVITGLRTGEDTPTIVSAHTPDGRLEGRSNPTTCREAPSEHIYWGDIHVMTIISAGLERPAFAYAYGRDSAHLDFCCVTDGDCADGHFTDAEWEETVQAVRDFHEPGRYVTLLGYECHERQVAGDKNIIYRDDQGPLVRWCDMEGDQPEAIWNSVRGTRTLTIPHHPMSGSDVYSPWDHHDPEHQRLVEIYSVWGSSECADGPRLNYWGRNNPANSVRVALDKGYRLGIVASGDSHDGLAGNSSWMRLRQGYRNGLVAVYAPELTREAVFDALWDRHCYGTTGARICLSFSVNTARMGQELTGSDHRNERVIKVEAAGTAPISAIEIIRNGAVAHTHHAAGDVATMEWTDDQPFEDVCRQGFDGRAFIYYYVRVTQEDEEMAWSSPIWVA